ncbi:site-specific integrase [Teredinibacter purpureus]|uniref:site-specific integrase n=1 Tax=Teredinibacter purpureus TaxID=2731756 RepID=UPI0005F7C9C1|nr:site-specific integrase [Teredinibacter purpureus]
MREKRYFPAPRGEDGAPAFTKPHLKHAVMVAKGSGRTPERDAALILCSATTGLRVSEIANIEVRHIIAEDGSYLLEGWIPGEFTKSGRSGAIFPRNKKFQEALDNYFEYRLKKKHMITDDLNKYKGLKPNSKVFLTETGRRFAMSIKKRTKGEGKNKVTTEYKACDVLERAFKRFYKRAFGEDTDYSSHSGRKYFANELANILDRKAEEHEFYDDIVELMRSQNLTSIQPYLMPTKAEVINASKKMY